MRTSWPNTNLRVFNDVRLHWTLDGPEDAPVVVLSNSLGTTFDMWDDLVPHLSGYRVLRYDTRGHGRSEVIPRPFDIDELADDMLFLLDAIAVPKAHFVGLSLGGMTIQALADRAPERVVSATLMATSAHMPTEAGWRDRARLVRERGMGAIADVTLERWFTAAYREHGGDRLAATRASLIATDPEGYARCCEAIATMDLRPRLAGIKVPVLVIAGRCDPATPVAMAEEICAGIPGADLVVLSGAAHLLAIERAERAAAFLLAHLSKHS